MIKNVKNAKLISCLSKGSSNKKIIILNHATILEYVQTSIDKIKMTQSNTIGFVLIKQNILSHTFILIILRCSCALQIPHLS